MQNAFFKIWATSSWCSFTYIRRAMINGICEMREGKLGFLQQTVWIPCLMSNFEKHIVEILFTKNILPLTHAHNTHILEKMKL